LIICLPSLTGRWKMFFRMHTIAVAVLYIFATILQGNLMASPFKPSLYERGHTVFVKILKVNNNGGLIRINDTGTPVDGTTIDIPKGALEREVTLAVGYDVGELHLNSGKWSGIVIILSTTPEIDFKKLVRIKVRFDRNVYFKTIVGYEIDNRGGLHSIDTGNINRNAGTVLFHTFKPLMFTWVYI
jgi:hypothetical protein